MRVSTLKERALAITAGLAFTVGALTILLGPALLTPKQWTSFHVLTILTVFGTTAAGHLMAQAGFRHFFSGFGFLTLFVVGTALVVVQSVGRQAEAFETNTMSVEAKNKAIAETSADLSNARARRDYADKAADREMTGQRCGPRCRDWRQNSKDVSVVIKQLETEIAALGPKKPVNPKADRMGDMLALFGVNKAKAVAMYTLIEPLLWTLFYEFGAIVSLGFAFRHGPKPVRIVQAQETSVRIEPDNDTFGQTDFPSVEPAKSAEVIQLFSNEEESGSFDPGNGPKRPRRWRRDEILADLTSRVDRGETFPSQRTLAQTFGVPTSTLSEYFSTWEKEGRLLGRTKVGRCKVVAKLAS